MDEMYEIMDDRRHPHSIGCVSHGIPAMVDF